MRWFRCLRRGDLLRRDYGAAVAPQIVRIPLGFASLGRQERGGGSRVANPGDVGAVLRFYSGRPSPLKVVVS